MNSPTSWNLYTSNDEVWASMLEDCSKARVSISLEQFIFIDDDFGRKLINVCIERAKQGVKVRFLWDAAGSFSFLGSDVVKELKEKGIELVFWKTLIPSYFNVPNFRSWFLRNHRRTLVIDNKIGYTGSICVSDRMKDWRDTNARFQGSVVLEMNNAFDRMWARANNTKKIPPRLRVKDPEFRYVTNYPAPKRRHVYSELIDAIRNARHYIYITTPYFVPTHRLARILRLAAHRGVEVKIILPERTDHYPTLDIAARSYFRSMLDSGVRIFLYEGTIIHSKSIVIDGNWATFGSMNLDSVSLLYNFEANIITQNTRFVEELSLHFVRDLQGSHEVDPIEWKKQFFPERILYFAIKFIRRFL